MKVARPDSQDLEAALDLLGLLDTVSRGYYPGEEEDAPVYMDEDDPKHLAIVYRRLRDILDKSPGFQGRVLFGAAALMDPRNQVINPDSDVIELHPRFASCQAASAKEPQATDSSHGKSESTP